MTIEGNRSTFLRAPRTCPSSDRQSPHKELNISRRVSPILIVRIGAIFATWLQSTQTVWQSVYCSYAINLHSSNFLCIATRHVMCKLPDVLNCEQTSTFWLEPAAFYSKMYCVRKCLARKSKTLYERCILKKNTGYTLNRRQYRIPGGGRHVEQKSINQGITEQETGFILFYFILFPFLTE